MPFERFDQRGEAGGKRLSGESRPRTPSNNAQYATYGNRLSQEPVMPQPTRSSAYNSIIPGMPAAYTDSPMRAPKRGSSMMGASPHYYPPPSPDMPASPRNEASPMLSEKSPGIYNNSVNSSMYQLDGSSTEKLRPGRGWGEKDNYVAQMPRLSQGRIQQRKSSGKKKWWIISILVLLLAAVAAVVAYFVVHNKNNNGSSSGGSSGASSGASPTSSAPQPSQSAAPPPVAMWGALGSTVTRDDGSTFQYNNQWGGTWCSVPFNDSARAQGDVPALGTAWDFSKNAINGVNLGGWLTLEPFITPAIYEPFANAAIPAVDEYTLSNNLGANLASTLTQHYETFITEDDLYQIAAAGLNWVRIGVPFWAIETITGEPFLEGVAWTYFLKAVEWCRKYGLRINFDFHAVPGSQNGWNHSGKEGFVGFMHGPMGTVNAQRTINYIRTITEFISQPEYTNVIQMFSFINEPLLQTITQTNLEAFYFNVYTMIRGITGIGKGPFLAFHDGFQNVALWYGFMAGADRVGLDSHPYLAFSNNYGNTNAQDIVIPCNAWSQNFNNTMNQFGFAMAGEFSLAFNDCGEYVNGVNIGAHYDGTYPGGGPTYGSCATYTDYTTWSPTLKQQMMDFGMGQMDATRNFFFWTWKIGNSTISGQVPNPMWSYQLGLQQGYMPATPRLASGRCVALLQEYGGGAFPAVPFNTLQPWMTGGAGAGVITDPNEAAYTRFPPVGLPALAYSATGASPITLPTPTYSGGSTAGNGWVNAADVGKWYVPTANGAYLSPYATAAGRAAAVAKRDMEPTPVPAGKRGIVHAAPTPAP